MSYHCHLNRSIAKVGCGPLSIAVCNAIPSDNQQMMITLEEVAKEADQLLCYLCDSTDENVILNYYLYVILNNIKNKSLTME
jgi:hypothetical protein